MAEHKMPSGIKRVKGEKGVYETLSGSHRIVQGDDKLWRVEGEGVESLKPAKSRGQAVAALFELGIVPEPQPAEAKAEPEQKPEPAESVQGMGGRKATGERKATARRPRTRKQPAKAVATV